MKYTKNYNFKKPEPYDTRNINDINDSFDLVDAKLKETQDKNINLDETFKQLIIDKGNSNAEIVASRRDKVNNKTYNSVPDRLDSVSSQLAQKANQDSLNATIAEVALKVNKSEVANGMTPKGNVAYASLPTTGNVIGNYYYCPDGDGVNPAGNYAWNGSAWYFGGTGDEGYSKLKSELTQVEERSVHVDGIISNPVLEYGNINVSSNKISYSSDNKKVRSRVNEYMSLKRGDQIRLLDTSTYVIRLVYSNDNGATWTVTTSTDIYYVPADGLYTFCIWNRFDSSAITTIEKARQILFLYRHEAISEQVKNILSDTDYLYDTLGYANAEFEFGNLAITNGLLLESASDKYRIRTPRYKPLKLKRGDILRTIDTSKIRINIYYTTDNSHTFKVTDWLTDFKVVDDGYYWVVVANYNSSMTITDITDLSNLFECVRSGFKQDIITLQEKAEHLNYLEYTVASGTISNGAELNANTRVRTSIITLGHTIKLNVKEGYKFIIHYYDSNSNFVSSGNWLTVPTEILQGTTFRLVFGTTTDTVIANLNDFKKVVYYYDDFVIHKSLYERELPGYWDSYIGRKINDIIDKDMLVGNSGDSFIFITDYHVPRNTGYSIPLSRYIVKNAGYRKLVIGGDIIHVNLTRQAGLEEAKKFKYSLKDIDYVFVRGNHDNNAVTTHEETYLTDKECYGLFLKPIEQKIHTDGKFYYHYDNTSEKIRYYVLDTDGEVYDNYVPFNVQLAWLTNDMQSLTSEWSAVVFIHRLLAPSNTYEGISLYSEFAGALENTIDNIYDSLQCTFVCVIGGHVHNDKVIYSKKGYPFISTTCDANGESAIGDFLNPVRTIGTTLEQAFDVYHIDKDNRKIYTTRIGAGADREFTY